MKKALILSLAFGGLLVASVGCKKKCNIPEEDSISGAIVEAIIYPQSGGVLVPSGLHIYDGHSQMDNYEVSFDGGVTRQTIDYSQYNIIGYPLTVKCDASVDRNVEIDNANQIVTFTCKVQECDQGCDELRNLENYVLVPAFPQSYTIIYNMVQ